MEFDDRWIRTQRIFYLLQQKLASVECRDHVLHCLLGYDGHCGFVSTILPKRQTGTQSIPTMASPHPSYARRYCAHNHDPRKQSDAMKCQARWQSTCTE